MPTNHVLYCGDSSLSGAAGYLAGLMTRFDIGYDYLGSDQDLESELASAPRKLFVLSDFPADRMLPPVQQIVLDQVSQHGAGLLMIGGWESFRGHGGNWNGSPLASALPVEISSEDDRINCDQPAMLIRQEDHPVVSGLPWEARPPTIGGFNRVTPRAGSQTLLLVQRFQAIFSHGRFEFDEREQDPMLVLGAHGAGRTACLMTDLAPHWVGGLVDWGDDQRVTAHAPGSWQIEVGNFYAQLVANLLAWTGNLHERPIS